jgi:KipI family sensor histidine kinase inhibitor
VVTGIRILPFGERAVLVEAQTQQEVIGLHAGLEASRPAGVTDLVPAARTILVRVDPRILAPSAARSWIASVDPRPTTAAAAAEVVVPIVYDGADLSDTAALLGISPDELVRRHRGARWTVAFTGFAPGFGYLVSPDWLFDVPRLDAPRTRVPAGSVGLAASFTGAYPRETPGGWRLIGTTPARLFDPQSAAPALLEPGAAVRFESRADAPVPAHSTASAASASATDAATGGPTSPPGIVVLEPGLSATVQDLGREGAGHLGVARAGAIDRTALRAADRLVGNSEGSAGIEVTMGGFRAIAQRDLWFAVAGAWGPVRVGGRAVDPYTAHQWRAGEELHLDWFAHGARAYIAVRGGIDASPTLGSRSTDRLAGIGPGPLAAGSVLRVGSAVDGPIPAVAVTAWSPPHDDELDLELAPGPRADWFEASSLAALYDSVWEVTGAADRVGIRLDGPQLVRARAGELPSEGMVPGALQVPPHGRPTILLADGPVTGGYPVIAVVTDASLDALGQARPGTRLRFRHARGGA